MKTQLLVLLLGLASICSANTVATFTPNLGQITDTKGNACPDIYFYTQQQGKELYFRDNAFSWVSIEKGQNKKPRYQRIDIKFLGATASQPKATQATASYSNYYQEGEYIERVIGYNKLTYHDIYPKTDLVFYPKKEGLKYDFRLKPGAASLIRWQYEGINSLSINKNGDLEIFTDQGIITESIPKVYFEENPGLPSPKVNYVIQDKTTVQLAVEKYPGHLTLVIDPLATWATFYGGTGNDYGRGLKREGNFIYMTGETQSFNFPVSAGASQVGAGGSRDAFITKFDLFGNRIWATFFGGSGSDVAEDIDVANGVLYIAGHSTGNLPTTAGAHQETYGSNTDAFLAKFSTNGILDWATYIGGGELDEAFDLAIDNLGDVVVTGATETTQFPVANYIATTGAFQYSKGGNEDVFVMKFNASGTRLWGTYLGGNDTERGYNIDTDSNNEIFVTGETYGGSSFSEFPVGGSAGHTAFQTTQGGGFGDKDAFLFKLSADGSTRRFGTFYGGDDIERGYGVVVDPDDNAIITGNVDGNGLPTTFGTYQPFWGGGGSWGNSDAFLVKFDNTGERLWATYYGGNNYDLGFSLDAPDANTILLVGETASSNLPATAGCFSCSGTFCGFVAQFDGDGANLEFASYLGGGSGSFNSSLDVQGDANDNVYVTGYTNSGTYPIGGNTFQPTIGGNADAFLGLVNSVTCQVLPLELLNFSARKVNNDVVLFWATANEIETAYFDLEISLDGENFSQLAQIPAAGNSNQTRQYDYSDIAPWRAGSPHLYYRLKMVDLDGSFTYSNIATVSNEKNARIKVFPNPTRDELTVTFDFASEKMVDISLIDLQGKTIATWPSQKMLQVQKKFNLVNYPAGIYVLQISLEGHSYFRKVVLF